jgi:hypothetical protein
MVAHICLNTSLGMSGWRVVLCGWPISSSRLYFETSMNLSLMLRMSPFLSASETMLVTFMMSVRTFSSVSTSSSRALTCASVAGVARLCARALERPAVRSASILGLLQFGAGQQARDP